MPDISVLVAVYFPPGDEGARREEGFRHSVKSWGWNLLYEGTLSPLIVVNDGPELRRVDVWWGAQRLLGHERNGLGASLNQGFKEGFRHSPLVLHLVDDTALDCHYDLAPWARMLQDDEAVGAVHLSLPYPGTGGVISTRGKPHRGGWVVTLDRHNLVAGLRPTLYHRRFFDAYGWFDEGLSAWETERLFNERFCQASGPESVLALPVPWAEGIGSTVPLGQVAPEVKA